jgi:RNA polymerase sigma-70 factor (sigma-E family)
VSPPPGFSEFVAERSPALLRTAWLLTGDGPAAEDLLQNVFAEVWPKWGRISVGASPEGYVRKVMMSRYLSSRRRRWWGEVPTEVLPEAPAHDDVAGRSATRDAVRRALAQLSPQQRAVVVLRFVEDQSIEDTARVLNCSIGTVKVQASRALSTLRSDPHLGLTSIVGWE